jgi:hypothetical protein
MPESPVEKRIENTVQHYLYRSGTFHDPSTALAPLPDTSTLIQQVQAAAIEQACSGFASSVEGSEWIQSVSRLIYAALDDARWQPSTEGTQKALMDAIN